LNYGQDGNSANRWGGMVFAVVLHVFLIYALVTGLARKAVEVIKQAPLETRIIAEVKPPPETPPPPPPPQLTTPPPPFIPPPEIQVALPPPPQAITQTTSVKPPEPRLTPPAPPAPPAPVAPPVRIAASIDPAKDCRDKPAYPSLSRRVGEEGVVVLEFTIEANGDVLEAKIKQSSGHPRLDEAAKRGLTTLCKFHPGTVDGKPERSTATIAYRWQLNAL
jgi:protein TonB